MIKKYFVLFTMCVSLFLFSCRKDITNVETPESYVGGSMSDVFEAFWNGMNTNYVFWDIDTTNWDNMYKIYKPVFTKLNINDSSDVRKSIGYFRAMTDGLIDSHYNLSFTDPVSDSSVSPSYDRKLKAGILRTPYYLFSYDAANYLDAGYIDGIDSLNLLEGNSTEAIAGTIDNGAVLFLGFSQFNLKASYDAAGNNGVKKAMQFFINYLRNPPTGFKGVIIDVRGNPGGSISDLNLLVGNFISTKLKIGYTRYKNGNGRLDYTPWADAIVTPQPGATAVTVPVIALTDIWSTSMSELTAMAIHTLPNGHTVGERTWGANGPLMFKYIDGKIYEGVGFPPDYAVPFDLNAFKTHGDTQLEKALSLML